MLAMTDGTDEHGTVLSRNVTWSVSNDYKLRQFFDDCAAGELGYIEFSVMDVNRDETTRFILRPTGKFTNYGGTLQAAYKIYPS